MGGGAGVARGGRRRRLHGSRGVPTAYGKRRIRSCQRGRAAWQKFDLSARHAGVSSNRCAGLADKGGGRQARARHTSLWGAFHTTGCSQRGTPHGASDMFILPPPLEAWGSLEQDGQHAGCSAKCPKSTTLPPRESSKSSAWTKARTEVKAGVSAVLLALSAIERRACLASSGP